MSKFVYDIGYINRVEFENISEGKNLRVKVVGVWPSLAWKFDREEVEVVQDKITVRVVGRMDPKKVSSPVMVPFEHTVKVKNLKEGVYTLEVVGKNENLTTQVTVNPIKVS
nr:hypothetical protein [Candidatus Freyarchaeota archaeon]